MNAPLPAHLDSHASGWQARLDLTVEHREARSVLTRREHKGPLRVQKALYPEGDAVCQILLLHPPAGIAGGDQLRIALAVDADARAQLTTPGAGKWYRSLGPLATQHIDLRIAPGACLEWLPQETIVYDQANADSATTITLAEGGRAIGWDIVCLGRKASGERFARGSYRQRIRLQRSDGTPLWREAMHLAGNDAVMRSAVGLGGHTVFGTLWIAGRAQASAPSAELVEALRALPMREGVSAVSALPDVTLVRVVAHSAEAARQHLEAAWAIARPLCLQRDAVPPRIWRT